MRIKQMLSKKSLAIINSKTTRQLNPIQLKKMIRHPSQRTTIDCNISNNNNINNSKYEYKDLWIFKRFKYGKLLWPIYKKGIIAEEKILYLNNDNLKLINIPYVNRARFLKKLKEIETM